MSHEKAIVIDDDNPEWTKDDFAKAQRGDAIPAHILSAFPNTRPRGRPKAEQTKVYTTIRLDPEIVAAFKSTGKGWQTRVNEALRQYVAEHPMGQNA